MTTGETENISAKVRENPPPVKVSLEDFLFGIFSEVPSSRLTFTGDDRAIAELHQSIRESDQAAIDFMDPHPMPRTAEWA